KKNLGEKPVVREGYFLVTPAMEKALLGEHGEGWRYRFADWKGGDDETWLAESYYRPGRAPITEGELKEEEDARNHSTLERNPVHDLGAMRPGTGGQGEGGNRTAGAGAPDHRHDQRHVRDAGAATGLRSLYGLDLSDLIGEPDSFKRQ